ncbi:single-strand DNA-binding protein [Hydrobacter penzbergensis]|uniref:Single-stranded DNA-binding protein n=1 Tax=Hydrobacter penzbergensis TaxID=1235997 RepID=A0A8X8LE42_9BACT|nr:single-stranded DNA-binding protein [Hydrobacter penzbergensis]SDW45997.1 single-strand DNA-binding protein [Hydrobacter penzbergensis]
MKTQNNIQLIGYLGADPVLRTAVNGAKLARFRMATDYYRRSKSGTVLKKTTWHNIIVWNKLAELCPGNFIKGSHILVQGQIRHRTYQDDSGHTQHFAEVRASQLLNLDR